MEEIYIFYGDGLQYCYAAFVAPIIIGALRSSFGSLRNTAELGVSGLYIEWRKADGYPLEQEKFVSQ